MTNALAVIEKHAEELVPKLDELEEGMTYTLADLIREGATVAPQAYTWVGENGEVCALTGALVAAKARHLL